MFKSILRIFIFLFVIAISSNSFAKDYNSEFNSDLLYRVSFGQADDVLHLLEKGANPHAENSAGSPAIVLAAGRNDGQGLKITKALIDAGASITVRDNFGNDALIAATKRGTVDTLKYILTLLPSMKVRDSQGLTLVQMAEMRDDYEILSIVQEAYDNEEQRLEKHKSGNNLVRLTTEYSFLYCAHGYLEYFVKSGDSKDIDPESYRATIANIEEEAKQMAEQLRIYFNYDKELLGKIRETSRYAIVRSLSGFQDINYRKKAKVGTDEDLTRRCSDISKGWKTRLKNLTTRQREYIGFGD